MRRDMPFIAAIALLMIFFIFLLYISVMPPINPVAKAPAQPADNWTISGMTGDLNMLEYYNYFLGDDGTIYTIDGKNIHAISPTGRIRWNLTIPDLTGNTRPLTWYGWNGVIDDGTFYVTLQSSSGSSEFLAISTDGKVIWQTIDPPSIFSAMNGRLYVSKNGNVTAYEPDGSIAWAVKSGFNPPLVDDSGTMYLIGGPNDTLMYVYSPDGKLKTEYNLTDYGLGPLMEVFSVCPQIYYNNHMVYVPLQYGMATFSDGGAFKWKIAYSYPNTMPMFWNEQFDRYGNVFLHDNSRLFYITPDGKEFFLTDNYDPYWQGVSAGAGLVDVENSTYYTTRTMSAVDGSYTNGYDVATGPISWYTLGPGYRSIGLMDTCKITAYDLRTGSILWNTTLPADTHVVNASESWTLIKSYSLAKSMLLNGTLYVDFWADNKALTDTKDGYAYAGGIYAIDKDGNILWQKPVDSRVLRMNAWNGSIIYCTADGNISAFKD